MKIPNSKECVNYQKCKIKGYINRCCPLECFYFNDPTY